MYLTVWIEGVHEMQQRNNHRTTNGITLLVFWCKNFNICIWMQGDWSHFENKPLALKFVVTVHMFKVGKNIFRIAAKKKQKRLPQYFVSSLLNTISSRQVMRIKKKYHLGDY